MTEQPDLRGAVSPSPGGSTLSLTVTPRASKNRLELQDDGLLRVRIAAPPVDGAANDALLKFLSAKLDIPRSRLTLASGEGNRRKRILVANVDAEELARCLHQALGTTR